jgi:hypothetical protein
MFQNTQHRLYAKIILYGVEALGFAGGMVFLLFALWYSISNASGHTGINIYWVSLPFIAYVLYGGGKVLIPCSKRFVSPYLILGLFGSMLPWVWDVTNILEQHSRWCDEGMPDVPPYRVCSCFRMGSLSFSSEDFFCTRNIVRGFTLQNSTVLQTHKRSGRILPPLNEVWEVVSINPLSRRQAEQGGDALSKLGLLRLAMPRNAMCRFASFRTQKHSPEFLLHCHH